LSYNPADEPAGRISNAASHTNASSQLSLYKSFERQWYEDPHVGSAMDNIRAETRAFKPSESLQTTGLERNKRISQLSDELRLGIFSHAARPAASFSEESSPQMLAHATSDVSPIDTVSLSCYQSLVPEEHGETRASGERLRGAVRQLPFATEPREAEMTVPISPVSSIAPADCTPTFQRFAPRSWATPLSFSTARSREEEETLVEEETAPERSGGEQAVKMAARVEMLVKLKSGIYSPSALRDKHLDVEELVAEAVGFLNVGNVHVLVGNEQDQLDDELSCAILTIGLEPDVSIDASMRPYDVAREIVRQGHDPRAPLRCNLRRLFAASIIEARVLEVQQAVRSASEFTILHQGYEDSMEQRLRRVFCVTTQRAAWFCWVDWLSAGLDIKSMASDLDAKHSLISLRKAIVLWMQNSQMHRRFKGRLRNLILRSLQHSMAERFAAWSHYAVKQQSRSEIVARVAMQSNHRMTRCLFLIWGKQSAHHIRIRRVCEKALGRRRHTMLSDACYRWCEALRLEDMLAQGLAARNHRARSAALAAWQASAKASRRFKELAPRVVGRWQKLLLSSSLQRWRQNHALCAKIRAICRRMIHRGLFRAVLEWHFLARKQAYNRKICRDLVVRWRHLTMDTVWKEWQSNVGFLVGMRSMSLHSQRDWRNEIQLTMLMAWRNNARLHSDLRAQLSYYYLTCAPHKLAPVLREWRIIALAGRPSQRLRDQTSLNSSSLSSTPLCPEAKRGMPQILPDAGLFDSIVGGLSASVGAKPSPSAQRYAEVPALDYCFPERFLRT